MALEVVKREDCQGEMESRAWLAIFIGPFWAYAITDESVREYERMAVDILNAQFEGGCE